MRPTLLFLIFIAGTSLISACAVRPTAYQVSRKNTADTDAKDPKTPQPDPYLPVPPPVGPMPSPTMDPTESDEPQRNPAPITPAPNPEPPSTPRPQPPAAGSTTLTDLTAYLAKSSLQDLDKQPFASQSLTKDEAGKAASLLWAAFQKQELAARQKEIADKVVKANGVTMRYETRVFGQKPAKGRSLYVSLHGGGMTSPAENDSQWRNQIDLCDVLSS